MWRKRVRPAFAGLLAVAAALLLVAWGVGRIASDRTVLTQYLLWIPTLGVLVAATPLLLVSFLLDRRAQHWRLAPIALLLFAVAHFSIIDLRLHRAWSRETPGATLSVLHWNMSYPFRKRWPALRDAVPNDPSPDVVALTNPIPVSRRFAELTEHLGPEYAAAHIGRLAVLTRLPILDFGSASLQVPPPWDTDALDAPLTEHDRAAPVARPASGPQWFDRGQILYVVLDADRAIGRQLTLWVIDLPSDRRLARDRLARYVARRLDQLRAGDDPSSITLPEPDLIVGDFNIPRGSASLRRITRGFRHAHDLDGPGYHATWPRAFPLYHIDHMFLAPWLTATDYRILDPGISAHRMQTARIRPIPTQPR